MVSKTNKSENNDDNKTCCDCMYLGKNDIFKIIMMLTINIQSLCIHFQYENTLIVNTYFIIMLVVGKIYLNCF